MEARVKILDVTFCLSQVLQQVLPQADSIVARSSLANGPTSQPENTQGGLSSKVKHCILTSHNGEHDCLVPIQSKDQRLFLLYE